MKSVPNKIVACRALAPILEDLLGESLSLTVLDIALHLQPDRLRHALLDTIADLEEENTTILLGYGLCGRALEGVYSRFSTLILPKVDDCVGMLLGSRSRHRQVLHDNPGSYFLEPRWLNSELNIFTQIHKGLEHIPEKRRRELLKIALKHYDRLILLSEDDQTEAAAQCRKLARDYDMQFASMSRELNLLHTLIYGPWEEPDFLVIPPNTPIPLF